MAESTLSITRTELLRAIALLLGSSRDPTSWSADETQDLSDVLSVGLRTFYQPPILPGETVAHVWSFMQMNLTVDLNAAYGTGTIKMTSGGVVTLTGGTWPSWAASGDLVVNGDHFGVATRNSSTQLTLDDTSVTAITVDTHYTLEQAEYPLADLFGGLLSDLYYTGENSQPSRPLRHVEYAEILELRQGNVVTARPDRYAMFPATITGSSGTRQSLAVWPTPNTSYTLTAPYIIQPWLLTSSLPYPMGGQPHSETLREACLAAAESEIKGEKGLHYANFQERLRASVAFDRRVASPAYLGYNGNGRRGSLGRSLRGGRYFENFNDVTYAGTRYGG